jgi:putative flippase GtrA
MHKHFSHEKVRFVAAGITNTALDFLLLNLLLFVFMLPTLVANALSVSVCILMSYFLNHYFVFKQQQPIRLKNLGVFFCITGFSSIVLQSLVISLFTYITHAVLNHLIIINILNSHERLEINLAKAVAIGVGMAWNFLLYKHLVFKTKHQAAGSLSVATEL